MTASDTVTRLQQRLTNLQNKRDLARRDVADARRSLRRREHTAKRQRAVAGRFNVILRLCWSFLYLGLATVGGGVVTTYASATTPLHLGGPIVACFVTGGFVTIAAIITLGTIYASDRVYVIIPVITGNDLNNKHMTRAEYADHTQHLAEEKLDDLTDLTIELQELDVELATVETNLSELT